MAGKPKELKLNNRREVLNLLREHGSLSVSALSKMTSLSRTTVMKSLMFFLKSGYVYSSGKGASTTEGGKRPEVYAFNSRIGYVCALSIHHERIYCGVFDLGNRMLINMRAPCSENESIDKVTGTITSMLSTAIEAADLSAEKLCGIVVGCDGLVEPETGLVRYATHFPSWGNDVPLADLVKCAIGSNIPVLVDNAVRQLGISELDANPTLHDKNVITIFHGESVSACIMRGGHPERGRRGYVGALGHTIIHPEDAVECKCGNHGCYESLTSRERLLNEAIRKFVPSERSVLSTAIMRDKLTSLDIFSAANAGDEFARSLVDWVAQWHAIAMHNLILNHDPDIVILQGDYAKGGTYFLFKLNRLVQDLQYTRSPHGAMILSSKLSTQKGFLTGAALQMIDWLFSDGSIYNG